MTFLLADRPSAPGSPLAPCDDTWFSEIYERTFESTYRYACMLTRDPDLSADIVGDVYLRAWLHRDTLKQSANPTAWMLTVTRNRVTDEFRSRKATVTLEQIVEPADTSSDDLDLGFTEADRAFLQQAIQRLTPEQQQVIFLRFYQRLSHEEVARELGRTANTVRATQFRALARLRNLLEASRVR